MHKAILAALGLHLLILLLFPDIPRLLIPSIDRGVTLNVFLRQPTPPDNFDQTLEQPLPLSTDRNNRLDGEITLVSPDLGEDEVATEEAPEQQGQASQPSKTEPSGQQASSDTPSNVTISFAAVRQFAKSYVAQQVQQRQSEFSQRNNSYRSDFSARRRTKTQSHRNRLGDIYVRDETSRGDICFVQQSDTSESELAVNIVQFFRCGRKPLELDLGAS